MASRLPPPHNKTLMHVRSARRFTEPYGIDRALDQAFNVNEQTSQPPDFDDLLSRIK